jgi:nitrite reductase (NADH) small subunit
MVESATYVRICDYDRLVPERGAAALVDGRQLAIFRTFDGMLYAVDNRDPFTGQNVLSRGIVGSRGGVPTVASPLLKQVFDLATGICVSDESRRIVVHDVRLSDDGYVEVRPRLASDP